MGLFDFFKKGLQ
ncbi:MAG TPA: hypothetical protein DEP00_02185, partial [Lachnospiraceae bacterium]|nr:hypothetical protein [Lachnospiraceae bacterium]